MLIDRVLALYDGLIHSLELAAWDFDKTMIDLLVNYGVLERLRKGWYGAPFLDPNVRRAVTVGGRLGCVSALAYLQGQPHPDGPLHVAVTRNVKGLRCPDDRRLPLDASRDAVVVHWLSEINWMGDTKVVSQEQAQRQARRCRALPPSVARAVLESARRP